MTLAQSVLPYSIETLKRLFVEKSEASPEVVSKKLHTVYFEEYFSAIEARTIVVEDDYVDRDFLEDFASYYVKCHGQYDRWCTRLHFFKRAFSADDFAGLLEGRGTLTHDELRNTYLGFIVVKPLPRTIVGRTCLATYPDGGGRRKYPITRKYGANLFGFDLSVETLAFQEQDQVTAACATSALWSVFHQTGQLFQHPIPTPVEITRAATDQSPLETRTFPNSGLTTLQMARATRAIGLEPVVLPAHDGYVLRSTAHAYLRSGLPLILVVTLADTSATPPKILGRHAIAVAGYSLGRGTPYSGTLTLNEASRMDKLYGHDDQVGPFARMVFDDAPASLVIDGVTKTFSSVLHTSWNHGTVKAFPDVVLVPAYHKIRIPLRVVHDEMVGFDSFVQVLTSVPASPVQPLKWDIYLTTGSEWKESIVREGVASGDLRRDNLLQPLPRFVWRALGRDASDRAVIDVLVDATDIEQGEFVVRVVEYDTTLGTLLRGVLSGNAAVVTMLKGTPGWRVLQRFAP